MKKKPRKPKPLYWYLTTLKVTPGKKPKILTSTVTLTPQPNGSFRKIDFIETPAAKKLWKWLKQATDYLESAK